MRNLVEGDDAVFANIICQASTIRLEVRRYCAGWTCNSMNKFGVGRAFFFGLFLAYDSWFSINFAARVAFLLTCQPDFDLDMFESPIHLSRPHDKSLPNSLEYSLTRSQYSCRRSNSTIQVAKSATSAELSGEN